MDSLKDIIKMLPNSVSGDGKVYASTIKKVLDFFGSYINDNVDEKLDQLGDGAAACVTGLRLTEQHTTDNNGMPQNNILVEYDNTNVENFLHCQIWVKDSTNDVYAQHGTASGLRYIIEDVRAGETYTVKAVSVNKQGGTSAFADSPIATITIAGSSLIPEPPRQFILTWDEVGPLWEWLHDDNGYVDFFELRLDAKAGEYSDNLLDRTRVMRSRANPEVRSGTAYLFVRNIFGTYSQPATLQFTKPVGAKPNKPTLEKTMYGISITMDALPSGYSEYKLLINGEEYSTVNRKFLYYQFMGQVTVKYCFMDAIGEGEYSDEVTVDIKTVLELVELPTIDRTKVDDSINNALQIADAQPDINSAVAQNLLDLQNGLTSTNTTLTNNMNDVADKFASVNASISNIGSDMTNMEGALQAEINKNTSAIADTNLAINSAIADTKATITSVESALRTDINENTASITTVAGNLKTLETNHGQLIQANTTAINQNAESITTVAQRVTLAEGNIQQNSSAITQNADSITAVVTELGKDPSECSYGAITALQDAVELRVMKDGIITAINVSPEIITIDGKFIHITGTTLIDNNVIVGGNIASNSITSAHIQANAITADKIDADAIHVGGANGNVTIEQGALVVGGDNGNVTIVDGAINGDMIQAGSIIGQHISAGTIGTAQLAASAVTAEKIAANSITAEKLAASTINLTGLLSIVGGAVVLDENGLKVSKDDGGYTLFNNVGITFIDKNGASYAQLHRMCIGSASNGQYVKFSAPFDSVPKVICIPSEMQCTDISFSANNTFIVCNAYNVTKEGFYVRCYTKLKGGTSTISLNKNFPLISESISVGYVRDNYAFKNTIGNTSTFHGFLKNFDTNVTKIDKSTQCTVYATATQVRTGKIPDMGHDNSLYTTTYKLQIIDSSTNTVLADSGYYTSLPKDDTVLENEISFNLTANLPSSTTSVTIRIQLAVCYSRIYNSYKTIDSFQPSAKVVSIKFDATGDIIVSDKGEAAFIAIENGGSDYTIL